VTLVAAWQRLPEAERRARCRAMQACVRLLAGPPGKELIDALRQAEGDPAALPLCDGALDALATVPRRRILASFLKTLPGNGR